MSSQQLVIFTINNEKYGVEITKVDTIIPPQEVFKVPNTPEYVEGLINLRGKVYTVFNLRKKFNLPEKDLDENTKIIIVKVESAMVGFIVDEVNEIISFDQSDIENTPQAIANLNRKYLSGIAKKGDRIILILDIDSILSLAEQAV